MSLTLQQALESYYGAERRRDALGLDGTRALLESLGSPERRFRAVHVAGTNGKGSVCALVERVLRAAGVRTGLYTSPHLVDFRERIRVSGRWADADRLGAVLEGLRAGPAGAGRTFFEVATALAFEHFAAQEVEWAVVEVGLGGRLDCTNVLAPAVTAITTVGLDHTEVLGTTLAEIAAEKAGIVKPGVPVLVGPLEPEAAVVVAEAARRRGARLARARERVAIVEVLLDAAGARFEAAVPPWGRMSLETSLRGSHQVENAAVALAILGELAGTVDLPAAAVREGFDRARWPGRLEPCPYEPMLWWDAAHNADGMARLVRAWREDLRFPPPEIVVLAVSRDKDLDRMLGWLRVLAKDAVVIATRAAAASRGRDPEELAAAARAAGLERAGAAPDVRRAVEAALVERRGGRVLLAGSIFAVGEAMATVGGAPGEEA